jgi:hypothetical protein
VLSVEDVHVKAFEPEGELREVPALLDLRGCVSEGIDMLRKEGTHRVEQK